jgi:AcrR family transcriptional regulator
MSAPASEVIDRTRQALDQAARTLFEERGYAGTPVRAITRKAGVSLSTFYAKYGSKKRAWLATVGTSPDVVDGEAATGRAARTRAALIVAARDVIERDGYHAARITDIAEQAGVAIGSFYHHFSCKQAIFTAVVEEQLAAFDNTASTDGDAGDRSAEDETAAVTHAERRQRAVERVTAAINRYLDEYSGHASLLLLRLDEAIGTHPELVALRLAVHRRFASAIAASLRRWQADGIADTSLDADHAADALTAMVGHATRVWQVFGSPHDGAVARTTLALLWCNGVGLWTPSVS